MRRSNTQRAILVSFLFSSGLIYCVLSWNAPPRPYVKRERTIDQFFQRTYKPEAGFQTRKHRLSNTFRRKRTLHKSHRNLDASDATSADSSLSHDSHPDHQHSKRGFRKSVSSLLSRVRRLEGVSVSVTDISAAIEVERLQQENKLLRDKIQFLETETDRLAEEATNPRIILESFEGEGRLSSSAGDFSMDSSLTLTGDEMLMEEPNLWCDELEGDQCPIEPTISFGEALRDRAYWLVGLLILQSGSGIILAKNEELLANHPVIIYFLTMLVGAGGNAGNQASVRVIRGLALGTLNEQTQGQFLLRELKMACALSSILSVTGFIRAVAFRTPLPETIAITTALSLIVFISICLGAILPLILKSLGVDPAHSSTSIQVIMDILGVVLAVVVSSALLDSHLGTMLVSRLIGN